RAIPRANVAPALEVVRARNVPAAHPRGFVVEEAQTDRGRHTRQRTAEVQINRGVVRRVTTEDEKRLDLPGPCCCSKRRDRVCVRCAARLAGVHETDDSPDAAERDVDLL